MVRIGTMYGNKFQGIYLGNRKLFLDFLLIWSVLKKKDQSHSLRITEIVNCETGSHLNVQKAIFNATPQHTTC